MVVAISEEFRPVPLIGIAVVWYLTVGIKLSAEAYGRPEFGGNVGATKCRWQGREVRQDAAVWGLE